MKTHRCKKSLENRMSIRLIDNIKKPAWTLLTPNFDFEYGYWHLTKVCSIEYCPFCGVKLNMEVQK